MTAKNIEGERRMAGFSRRQTQEIEDKGTTEGVLGNGLPIVLLTTTGAKSGEPRSTPVMRVEHNGIYAAVGSKGAMPGQPSWYYNVLKTPNVLLQDGSRTIEFTAREAEGSERDVWWQRAVNVYPAYAEMQRRTSRRIPVIVLDPTSQSVASESCSTPPLT